MRITLPRIFDGSLQRSAHNNLSRWGKKKGAKKLLFRKKMCWSGVVSYSIRAPNLMCVCVCALWEEVMSYRNFQWKRFSLQLGLALFACVWWIIVDISAKTSNDVGSYQTKSVLRMNGEKMGRSTAPTQRHHQERKRQQPNQQQRKG